MKDIDRKTESKEFNEEGKKRRWTIFFFSSVAVVSVWMILIQFDGCMGDSLNWTSFRVVDIAVCYLVLKILYWIFVSRSIPPSNWRSFNVLPALFILPHKKTPFNVNYPNGTFSSFLIFLFKFFSGRIGSYWKRVDLDVQIGYLRKNDFIYSKWMNDPCSVVVL